MRKTISKIAFSAIIALLMPCVAPAQPATSAQASPSEAGNSIGDIYGTRNMDGLPGFAERQPAPSAQVLARTRANQEVRTQPPSDLSSYIDYVRRDPLLEQLRALAKKAPKASPELLVLLAWNHVALDMTSLDHTTVGAMAEPTFGEQWGPARSSRAMSMVHLAMFEAANAVDQRYHSYSAPGSTVDLRSSVLQAFGAQPTVADTSVAAAVAEAGYRTLVGLYPRKSGLLLADTTEITSLIKQVELNRGGDVAGRITFGQQLGDIVAAQVLAMRAADHSGDTDATNSCSQPGQQINACLEPTFAPLPPPPAPTAAFTWTYDPVSRARFKLGAFWSHVTPFLPQDGTFVTPAGLALPGGVMLAKPLETDASFASSLNDGAYGQMRPEPHGGTRPAALDAAHQADLDRYLFGTVHPPKLPSTISSKYGVRQFGGAGDALPPQPVAGQGVRTATPTSRTAFQTSMAEFWGYDGVALLCAPPRLYNMIATSFYLDHAIKSGDPGSVVDAARYLALVNVALADAGIDAWKGKYDYLIARPVTYIRFHAAAGQPSDASWTPLGQTGSNGLPYNTTPPFPAYPSGHAVFGGAAFTAIALALGVDKAASPFDFVSDEFNGHTVDGSGNLRPFMKVHFASLEGAEWENAESRIWLGIHWQRDADDGTALGQAIGRTVVGAVLRKCVKSASGVCG